MFSNTFAASWLATASLLASAMASPISSLNDFPSLAGTSDPQLAVYWGQGPGQKRLSQFCQDTTMDIIPIGFVNVFPDQQNGPGNNYGNACGSDLWVSPDGKQTQMLTECSQIAEDIKTCQAAGKKIFASIGGALPGGNFLASKDSATAFADFLWGSFGPLQDSTLKQFPRPFGTDTIVDGFDLDIESGPDSFYSDLVNELRAKFATSSKSYYISAAPQCIVPDAHLDEAIQNSNIDYLFIQYYNTDQCSAASLFSSGSLNTNTDITFGWLQWLKDNSQNKNVKIFLGLPASTSAAHPQDYLDISKAKSLIDEYACSDTYSSMFGGVMLFDATYSDQNTDADLNGQSYAYNIKQAFGQLSCSNPPQTTTTSISPSSSSSNTSSITSSSSSSLISSTTSTYSYPIGGTASSDNPSSTTIYSYIQNASSSSSSSLTAVFVTPSSYSWANWSSIRSKPVDSITTTSSHNWADWTPTSSKLVDPVTTSSYNWADWTRSSTKPGDPITTISSSAWADWEASKTSSTTKAVDPTSTSSSYNWTDWEQTTSTANYTSPTATALMTQTVVPVKPSESAAIDHSSGYTSPSFVVSTAVKPSQASVAAASSPAAWNYPQGSGSTLTSVAAAGASSSPASNSGWVAPSDTRVAAASSTPSSVVPLNVTPFTGGAAQQKLPGTVMSVALCVVVAVVGLFL